MAAFNSFRLLPTQLHHLMDETHYVAFRYADGGLYHQTGDRVQFDKFLDEHQIIKKHYNNLVALCPMIVNKTKCSAAADKEWTVFFPMTFTCKCGTEDDVVYEEEDDVVYEEEDNYEEMLKFITTTPSFLTFLKVRGVLPPDEMELLEKCVKQLKH